MKDDRDHCHDASLSVPGRPPGLAHRARTALTTAAYALAAMARTQARAMHDATRHVPSAFRRGWGVGLLALARLPLTLLGLLAEAAVSLPLLLAAMLLELCGGHRGLRPHELAEARKVFGASIDLSRVRIATASVPADLINAVNGHRPFTTLYLINTHRGAALDTATLIHELAHVWQGVQTGPLYMARALKAQLAAGLRHWWRHGRYDDRAAYAVTLQALQAHAGDFARFNPEGQASIVEHYWVQAFSGRPRGSLPPAGALAPYARVVFQPPGESDRSD